MIGRLRARRPDPAGDGGMSLVELLVAMMVTSVLLAAVATVFTGTLRDVRGINSKTSSTADARIAMEAMTRTIRVAYQGDQASALSSANTNALTFWALLNRTGSDSTTPLPTFVEYAWNGTCLTEAQTPGRTNSAGVVVWDTGRSIKCLARTSVAPVFAYYTTGAAVTALTVPASGLTAANLQTVQSIQVSLNVTDAANPGVTGIPLVARITLINVKNRVG